MKAKRDRITAVVCTNMDDSEKVHLLVVGKSMETFHKFVCLNRKMASNNKMLFFTDQCAAHRKNNGNLKESSFFL
jgi:predicted transcriptional regulator YheO